MNANILKPTEVEDKVITVRGLSVILDVDVATLYGVETKRINEAVKNNPEKFPDGYILSLPQSDANSLRSKFSTLNEKTGRGRHSKYAPKAFTEKGLYMLATILKSPQATAATIAIIETFTKVRSLKRELISLHDEKDAKKQQAKMQHFGEVLSDIVMPDLETSETESSLELNFIIGKLKHTVKRVKKNDYKN